ncbi:unnamed protein product [Parnassius mnemosyne]|uniref:F-box domain-containing protein n=1 Tax=Parnassius mnemosyne TaxID=213953 RepID=A0AAV1L476_9NEOP
MDKFPDEILLMIFEWLPAHEVCAGVARVCRRWARVARRRALSLRHARHLKRLRHRPRAVLAAARLPEPAVLFRSLELLAPCLRELSIHAEMPLSDNELRILASLPHLRHLDVFARSRFLGSSFLPVAKRLGSLVVNENVARGVFRTLASPACLHALHMYGRSLHYPRRDLLFLLRASVDQLCELTLRCNELNDAVYEVISSCSNLKTLQLYSCWLMTRTGAMYLTHLKQLRCLHITGARMVRNRALAALIHGLPQTIEELVLSASWFSDEHIPVLIEKLPGLRVLELWRCRASADGLTELVNSLPILEQFDTDMMLGSHNEHIIAVHPSLKIVRCRLDTSAKTKSKNEQVKYLAADTKYLNAVLRGDGEGYRADLFYYWTQRVPLETLPQSLKSWAQPYS